MTTVLEQYTTEEQRSVVRILRTKGLNAKDIHKKMFPVYGGKCLSRKAVHNWVKRLKRRCEVAETTVKRFLCGKEILVEDMWKNRYFSHVPASHVFCFIQICGLFTDSPSYSESG
jgi:hypothetical protein